MLDHVTPLPPALVATTSIMLASGFLRAECEPANFRVAIPFLSSTSLEISWEDTCDDETEYEFQVLPEGQDWFTIATAPANSTLLSLRGGSPNTTASFRMRTVRPDGHSEWTEGVEVTLPSGFAIEAGQFVGGTVGEPLTGPALQIYTAPGEEPASSFGVTDLPPSWDFDPTTGVISGTPAAPGVYRPMVSATNGTSEATTFVTFRIKPAPAGPEEHSPVPDFLFLAPPSGQIRHDLAPHFRDPDTTIAIRFETNLGDIDSILYPEACPAHIENLLNYIDRGDYDGVIFHRSATLASSGVAVVQAGLMKPDGNGDYTLVVTDPNVVDEPGLSNRTGTLAMAKTNAPNSGSSQVYFNTIDNTTLDGPGSNGGYTVFGRATSGSLPVLADMHARPRGNYSATVNDTEQTLTDWPTTAEPEGNTPAVGELVQIVQARRLQELLSYRLGPVSNPSLVTASLNGTELTLNPIPGATGTSTLTVEVSDLDGTILPVELSYCVLDLDFRPGLSANDHPTVTFQHEKEPANLSYEVQSSLDGQNWTTYWETGDGTMTAPVIAIDDLGNTWQLTVEDTSITSPATRTALLRIVVSK
ncbi:MAG: peptidylprolyl isomerase [Verrucomicrobiota bacterium]|nr:peptidylprolyl isomerase [Verrucomicrobiota bacterium]